MTANEPRGTRTTKGTQGSPTLVIALLIVSTFVVVLNETIMGVALPRLIRDLDVSASLGQWLTTGFLLTVAVIIPTTGYLLQRFTTRTIFLAAMGLFSVGTLCALLAPGFSLLLVGRIIQAGGTALMMPLLVTTVLSLIPPERRGRVMGSISIVVSVAPAIGPTISGIILQVLPWRALFGFVLPIAIAALILGAMKLRNVPSVKNASFDAISVVLSVAGFGGIVFGLSSLNSPESIAVAITTLGIGLAALAGFIARQTHLGRHNAAMLDLRVFRNRSFTVAVIAMCTSMIALFGTLIVLPIYLEAVLGLPVLQVGLLLLPGGLIQGALAPIVGRIYDRYGPRVLVIPGSILVSGALWMFSTVNADTEVWMVQASYITLSVGFALSFTPYFTSALGGLAPSLYSHGSAIVGTAQQLAGAIGTSLFIAILTQSSQTIEAGSAGTIDGIRAAFTCGAFITLGGIVVAFFVRRYSDNLGVHSRSNVPSSKAASDTTR